MLLPYFHFLFFSFLPFFLFFSFFFFFFFPFFAATFRVPPGANRPLCPPFGTPLLPVSHLGYSVLPAHHRTIWCRSTFEPRGPGLSNPTSFLRPALPMAPTTDNNARDERSVLRPNPATFLRVFTLYMTTKYAIIRKRCLNYITCLTHKCIASFLKDTRFRLKLRKKSCISGLSINVINFICYIYHIYVIKCEVVEVER